MSGPASKNPKTKTKTKTRGGPAKKSAAKSAVEKPAREKPARKSRPADPKLSRAVAREALG